MRESANAVCIRKTRVIGGAEVFESIPRIPTGAEINRAVAALVEMGGEYFATAVRNDLFAQRQIGGANLTCWERFVDRGATRFAFVLQVV